jgi:hypothetical protein
MDSATGKRGFKCKVPLVEVVESIAYFTTSINGLNQAVGSSYELNF